MDGIRTRAVFFDREVLYRSTTIPRVRLKGFEPLTLSFEGSCSIQTELQTHKLDNPPEFHILG